jgi:hypothetical protein
MLPAEGGATVAAIIYLSRLSPDGSSGTASHKARGNPNNQTLNAEQCFRPTKPKSSNENSRF